MAKGTEQSETAERIIAAATTLFAQKQFGAVSIKDIGREAGTNSALISYYFGGKQQLYEAVLNRQSSYLLAIIDRLKRKRSLSPLAKLTSYVNAINDLQMGDRSRMQLLYRELLSPSGADTGQAFTDSLLQVHSFMADLIAKAQGQGLVRADLEVRHIAAVLEGMIVMFFITYEPMQAFESKQPEQQPLRLKEVLDSYLKTITIG